MRLRSLPYYVKAIREKSPADFTDFWLPKFQNKYKVDYNTSRECWEIVAVPKHYKVKVEMTFAYYLKSDTVYVRGTTKFDRNGLKFLIENLL